MKYKSNLINIQINNQLKPWNSYECIPSHQFSSPHRRRTTVWFFQSETGVKKQRTAPSRPNVIPFRASNVTQKLPEVFGQITGLMPSEAKQPLARNLNGFLQVCNLFLELPIVPLAESWNDCAVLHAHVQCLPMAIQSEDLWDCWQGAQICISKPQP